ncbi:cysteine proteinase inhibitor [Trifolium pratense]|uniref:Cysteine proteinase inhibitor n=1 Tax=Trifolium pratense TaxID=57577 RepID=A0A2K3K3A2_TRIPR|nr:cysteine proteinase inhibitor [Trifolium pratense]
MRFQSLVLLMVIMLASIAIDRVKSLGGFNPVNINDPHVIEIANFAVNEYNKEKTVTKLKLVRIIKGESQVVAGINYRLIILASDASSARNYEAIVFEKQNFKSLTSFKLAHA